MVGSCENDSVVGVLDPSRETYKGESLDNARLVRRDSGIIAVPIYCVKCGDIYTGRLDGILVGNLSSPPSGIDLFSMLSGFDKKCRSGARA